MGVPGPDAGKGGKYLIVPDSFNGDLPKDVKSGGEYFRARSPSYVNWLILRGFLVDGKPDAAAAMFRNGLKIYPLASAGRPPQMQFIKSSKVPFNTIHANTSAAITAGSVAMEWGDGTSTRARCSFTPRR
jgi:hypothetical protein